jgi:cytochrome c
MNKIIVSIVLVIILILGINKIADTIFHVDKPEKSTYQVTAVTNTETAKTSAENSESENIMTLFASTNADEGAKVFKSQCAACHSITKGGSNKIGPALWGVLGKQTGTVSDYKYSKGMTAYGKPWSFEEMNGFLTKPKDWIKGTKMSFAGLKNIKERAAVILYMNKNTDNPLPLN